MSETAPAAPAGPPYSSLTQSPTNLKEAIDWILRVTNKDGQQQQSEINSQHCLCPLSQAVVTVLRDVRVKEYIGSRNRDSTVNGDLDEEWDLVSGILSSIETIGGVRTTRNLIQDVASKLAEFIGYQSPSGGTNGKPELTGSGIGCPGQYKGCSHKNTGGDGSCSGYQSSYNKDASISGITGGSTGAITSGSDSGKDSWTILAKIFLGAIPLVFSGLSYMYWAAGSADGSGGREGFKKDDTVNNESQVICHYLKRMGFETSQLRTNGTNGSGIKVEELRDAIKKMEPFSSTSSDLNQSFAMYLEKVRDEVRKKVSPTPPTTGGGKTTEHALLKLNTLCTGYFRALNQPYRVHRRNHRLPRTIREILYWLSCVQYCPVFRILVQKMQELCQRVGGDTGITFYSGTKTCKIDSSNCVSYFLSAALVAPMVLLSIQDTIQSVVGHLVRESDTKTPGPKPTHEMIYEQKIDRLASTKDPVPIHDLYANTLFEFRFPISETESYYLLQDCLVALYYQMYFLKQQCNFHRIDTAGGKTPDGFDWTLCRYGDGVNGDQISGWKCTENKGENKEQNQCGQSGTPSPLQAFLCDCLPGFTCKTVCDKMKSLGITGDNSKDEFKKPSVYLSCYMEFLEHRNHLPVGQECAVPMGFSGSFRSKDGGAPALGAGGSGSAGSAVGGKGGSTPVGMSGLGINGIVMYYVNDDLTDSCLYQLVRCICSLTRRVPRSTGTLYGFFQGIISVYGSGGKQGGDATQEFKGALDVELQLATFGLGSGTSGGSGSGTSGLMKALEDWKGKTGDHKTSGDCCSLNSLSDCKGSEEKADGSNFCGKYLHPISGSLYNSVATQYCDTYLSWILYLTGVLKAGLESLLDEFRNINCKECKKYPSSTTGVGGSGSGSGTTLAASGCSNKCKDGNHGTASGNCSCDNLVICAGVYSVFYRFGFSYVSPSALTKEGTKRTCHDFYTQLKNVIDGNLFTEVLDDIRRFLYTTRLPFGLMIFCIWSIVLVYLLWSMTVNLDLMHIQSHWKSPTSHLVPLQRILADGSRKGFCTLGYFQEANGDRLVSEDISDVYL